MSQDTEALTELISLSSSQLEDIENSVGDGCEEEDEEVGKDKEAFCKGSEHAQLLKNRSDQCDDQVLPPSTVNENNEAGNSRKRPRPGL